MILSTRRSFGLRAGALAASSLLPSGARATGDLAKTVLRVGDQTGALQSKLRIARLLDDLPYKIEWSVFSAALNLHEALRADAIDIGGANDSPTVSAIASGSKIAIVAAWRSRSQGVSLLVPKHSSVRSLAELRGKTVSPTTRGSVAHFLLLGELKRAGVDPREINIAFLAPADASAAFASGKLDAWATWGLFEARARGALQARVLATGEGINSGLSLYSATRAAVRDAGKLAAIADLAKRVDRGFEWTRANRQAHIAWYADFTRQDPALIAELYGQEAENARLPVDDALVERLAHTFGVWVEAGVLGGSIDFNDYVYRSLPWG
ncbi:MAG: aliphatic sulfonate ABC transporter substrate-binding protein [Methylocystaceae bacterium]|nr:MAG: aliphatic sulfonate ABC transporter substrate-binding protein [Methylocystaceae bacterium]